VKIGFSLDERASAPRAWNVQPARFDVTDDPPPPHVNTLEVAKPILVEKLVEGGYPRNLAESEIVWAFVGDSSSDSDSEPGVELIQEILGTVLRGVMNTEESTRKEMTNGLMNGLRYIDIPIPLLGYHALDFYVNEDEGALIAMWDRAWRKTIEALLDAAGTRRILPTGVAITTTATPFD
jgi:hypothetical protein